MSDRQLELAARRAALIARSGQQREHLKVLAGTLKGRLAGIDQGIEVARTIAKKPLVVVGAIAMVSFIGPRRVLRALTRSAMFIATGQRLVSLWRGSRKSPPLLRGP